jgi:hypothetical protein
MEKILPYASEPFGVYQPLIGWRSQLHYERLSSATANRVLAASNVISRFLMKGDEPTVPKIALSVAENRTGTSIGQALAARVVNADGNEIHSILTEASSSTITTMMNSVLLNSPIPAISNPNPPTTVITAPAPPPKSQDDSDQEIAMAAALRRLAKLQPLAIKQLFHPSVNSLDRSLSGAGLFSATHPARSAFLSPIGILHLFREYFFEIGTFLGPPVGHVWISPGGTVELVEVNTRKTTVEQTTEQSTQTTSKQELDTTDRDEISDAVKNENASDTKLGASATASGGVGSVFHASGTASFNMDESRKQAQEQTHKKMREQSAKLSSEVRTNFKTTFRTSSETTDTSSRRYVLENKTDKLVSYELSRKMRKVAVQVQDLGERLCWQLYVDNPGDPLGTGEFVHATGEALDPSLKAPDTIPYPPAQTRSFSSAIPFILLQGADHGADDTYQPQPADPTHGFFSPDVGRDDIIQFRHTIKCPPTPADFVLSQVTSLDFHGAEVKWDPNLNVDLANQQFTITLTYAHFAGQAQLPFDVTLVYEPTADVKARIDKSNNESKAQYTDQLADAKEKAFFDTLRKRLKLLGSVQSRSQNDLRDEERNVIYRNIVSRLYGKAEAWKTEDYHVASEMIRYFFDIDSMLYFVAQDWWRPRTQQLVSKNDQGQYQATVYTDPPLSHMVAGMGTGKNFHVGQRPYYLITEETAPAPMGSSLGWLIQLDGDTRRNAFLNSPWVKAVLPIRPGREREAITYLQRPEVADTDGLNEPYAYDPATDPPEYKGLTIEAVLLKIADKIKEEYLLSLKPVPITSAVKNSKMALPTETVFANGFDPLEGGIAFNNGAFKVFSEWTEVLPTDQVVATEYSLKGL